MEKNLDWSKAQRMRTSADFCAVYEQGTRYYTRSFVLVAGKTKTDGRVGLSVSKKCGCAVKRNRIKRILREFFRLNPSLLPPCDLVVSPKKNVPHDGINLALAEDELIPLLHRLAPR